ncbi:MAG: helix-hairpin-helix domain-containing protein [Chitinophagaceae bacterium]|nr:helix-hairpin-helix domain-containing protein [Chitinophagaceae bacterium]
MKQLFFLFAQLLPIYAVLQELPSFETEQQLEQLTEIMEDAEIADDTWWQQLEYLKKHRLNLNTATPADLKELQLLSDLQIGFFTDYRKALGNLVSTYELQAVPGWDLPLIRQLLPYITVATPALTKESLRQRFGNGEQHLLLRYARVLEKAKGYREKNEGRSFYAGDPNRLMIRYKYQYKNLLQYGITLSKDGGERLWINRRGGLDFHSFHLSMGKTGIVKSFVLGDYIINMGQGLIHWQGMAFGKGASISNIKRQSPVLRPYNSSGAFYFHRGGAVTLEKKNREATFFLSFRNMDARTETNALTGEDFITSISSSGLHRTQSEKANQGNLRVLTYGGNLRYRNRNWYAGMNLIKYHFNYSLQRQALPYNFFALSGKNHLNFSVDYGYTFKNLHFFGEAAIDKAFHTAYLNGLLLSVHSKASLSLLHRRLSKSYQAFYGNAFAANTSVSNETGLYAGLSLKPAPQCSIDFYTDLFHFPWLKYRIDAPSYGKDFFLQFTWKPAKLTELYSRYRVRQKSIDQKSETNALNEVVDFFNRSWRTQVSHRISRVFLFRQRVELLWYNVRGENAEKGFLAFFDIFCNPSRSRLSMNLRLQFFESDSYNSRLYAYENDVLYYYSIPVFYDRGTRYYFNIKYKVRKNMALWVKWGQTIYGNRDVVGSGLDEIEGNTKSDLRISVSATF